MSFRRLSNLVHEYVQFSVPRTRGHLILQRQRGWMGGIWLLEASMAGGKGDPSWADDKRDSGRMHGKERGQVGKLLRKDVRLGVGPPES